MNDNSKNKASGFTIVEILVAVFIISIGVLALSQMEILSLRQYQLAEQGTMATNIIQFISDRDVAEVKRRTLLNNEVYLDYLNARNADFDYCDGTDKIYILPLRPLYLLLLQLTLITVMKMQLVQLLI